MKTQLETLKNPDDAFHFISIVGEKDEVSKALDEAKEVFAKHRLINRPMYIENNQALVYRAVGPCYDVEVTKGFSRKYPDVLIKGSVYAPVSNTFILWQVKNGVYTIMNL